MAQQENDMIELYKGDCFKLMKDLPDKSVNLFVCDPPYLLDKNIGHGNAQSLNKSQLLLKKEIDLTDGYDIEGFASEVKRLQKDINCYFWCNKKQINSYFKTYVDKMKCKFDILSWHKTNAQGMFWGKYLSDTEYLLHFFKGKGTTFPQNYEDAHTYMVSVSSYLLNRKWGHPTIKPMEFIRRIIRNSSRVGGLVVDPFMGSGTTAIACMLENRRFKGYEINDRYYEIALRRIENFKKNGDY